MATPDQLAKQGDLHKLEIHLEPGDLPQQRIFAMPRVTQWLKNQLPALRADGYHDGAMSPKEQAYEQLRAFVVGDDLSMTAGACGSLKPAKLMHPPEHGIWELRTFDLRFFGWFWRKSMLIISAADTKARCRDHNLYSGYLDQALRDRETLNLDEPKFLSGGYDDCFHVR